MKRIFFTVLISILLFSLLISFGGCGETDEAALKMQAAGEELRESATGDFRYFLLSVEEINDLQASDLWPYRDQTVRFFALNTGNTYEPPAVVSSWCHAKYLGRYGVDITADLTVQDVHPLYEIYERGDPITLLYQGGCPDIFDPVYLFGIYTTDPEAGSFCDVRVGGHIDTALNGLRNAGFSVPDAELSAESIEHHFTVQGSKDGIFYELRYGQDFLITHIRLYATQTNKQGVMID